MGTLHMAIRRFSRLAPRSAPPLPLANELQPPPPLSSRNKRFQKRALERGDAVSCARSTCMVESIRFLAARSLKRSGAVLAAGALLCWSPEGHKSMRKLTNAKSQLFQIGSRSGVASLSLPLCVAVSPSNTRFSRASQPPLSVEWCKFSIAQCSCGGRRTGLALPLEMASTLDTMVLSYGAAALTTLSFLVMNSTTLRAEGDLGLQQAQSTTQHPFFCPSRTLQIRVLEY